MNRPETGQLRRASKRTSAERSSELFLNAYDPLTRLATGLIHWQPGDPKPTPNMLPQASIAARHFCLPGNGRLTAVHHQFGSRRIVTSLMLVAFTTLFLSPMEARDPVAVQRGDVGPDESFGQGGFVTTSTGEGNESFEDVAVQSDGRIVAVGTIDTSQGSELCMIRYNTDGSLDTTFGSDGKVKTQIGTTRTRGEAIALQPDGKIVVGGDAFNGSHYEWALVRYLPDGELDETFGESGKITTTTGTGDHSVAVVCIQPDGRVILTGEYFVGENSDIAVVRYNTDGSMDSSFGTNGKAEFSVGPGSDRVQGTRVLQDGKIVLSGWTGAFAGQVDPILVRLNSDGTLDSTFDDDGKVHVSFGMTMAVYQGDFVVLPSGKILTCGVNYIAADGNQFCALRYNPNGSLDTSFDADGLLISSVGHAGNSVVEQPGGMFCLGGNVRRGDDSDFAVARYHENGELDDRFGTNGVFTFSDHTREDVSRRMVQQKDGRFVIIGSSHNGADFDFALARCVVQGSDRKAGPDSGEQ
ncbi:MAG: delta-60 repeat domain-containing protein [Planctomycetaceae bacterium]